MKKIIFTDVDGTIIDIHGKTFNPSEYTVHAFNDLKKNNHVFVASGRTKCIMQSSVLKLDPSGYILANGAYVEYEGKVVFSKEFSKDDINDLLNSIRKYHGTVFLCGQDAVVCPDNTMEECANFARRWSAREDAIRNYDISEHVHLIIATFKQQEDSDAFKNEMSGRFTLTYQGKSKNFDIVPKGVDKGLGVLKAREYLCVEKENTYGFGDAMNDIRLFEAVGHNYCVGNGMDELKKVADEVCESCDDEGFYKSLLKEGIISAYYQ